jgi:hypothetical protein
LCRISQTLDPTFEQVASRGLEIGDDEIDVASDPTGASVSPLPTWIEQREADLIDIEPQRSLDIAHRQRDHFD